MKIRTWAIRTSAIDSPPILDVRLIDRESGNKGEGVYGLCFTTGTVHTVEVCFQTLDELVALRDLLESKVKEIYNGSCSKDPLPYFGTESFETKHPLTTSGSDQLGTPSTWTHRCPESGGNNVECLEEFCPYCDKPCP